MTSEFGDICGERIFQGAVSSFNNFPASDCPPRGLVPQEDLLPRSGASPKRRVWKVRFFSASVLLTVFVIKSTTIRPLTKLTCSLRGCTLISTTSVGRVRDK